MLFLLVLSLIPLSHARPEDSDQTTANAKPREEAPQKLLTIEQFAIGGVGYAGVASRPEIWFRAMLERPDSVAECQKLVNDATPAGQLYGLFGLRLRDQKAFFVTLPKFKDSKKIVRTMRGCIVFEIKSRK